MTRLIKCFGYPPRTREELNAANLHWEDHVLECSGMLVFNPTLIDSHFPTMHWENGDLPWLNTLVVMATQTSTRVLN